MPNSHTTIVDIIDMDALVSTNPSNKLLFNSTNRCSVLLLEFLCMLILHTIGGPSTLVEFINFKTSSFFFFANLTRLSKDSNSLHIVGMVSMGDNEIFPLMKCVNILNFIA